MRYDESVRESARTMRGNGATVTAIAFLLGVSATTVLRWIDPGYAQRQQAAVKAWREEHPGCMARWSRDQRAEHPEHTRAATRKYGQAHKEEARLRSRAHYERNKERVYAKSAARRAKTALAGLPAEQREAIARVYATAKSAEKVRCYLCGKLIPMGSRHVDHIVPLSKGGRHEAANLAVACAACNWVKNAKLPDEIGLLV